MMMMVPMMMNPNGMAQPQQGNNSQGSMSVPVPNMTPNFNSVQQHQTNNTQVQQTQQTQQRRK